MKPQACWEPVTAVPGNILSFSIVVHLTYCATLLLVQATPPQCLEERTERFGFQKGLFLYC